jgi:hypothetical protein
MLDPPTKAGHRDFKKPANLLVRVFGVFADVAVLS